MLHTGSYRKPIRIIWPAVLLIAALLAGCTAGENAAVTATGPQIGLETLVAEAVVTAKAATPLFPTGMPTGLSARTSTPTITPIPTATVEGAPTQSDNPTAAPSGGGEAPQPSPTIFITLTPPGMPTRSPSDPALTYGEPDWTDAFESDTNWGSYQTERTQLEVGGGQLRLSLFETGTGPTWALSWPTMTNFYLEATAQTPQQCSGKDAFGLVFRAPDADSGYRLELFCDGGYRLLAFSPSENTVLSGAISHPAINVGPNQINRLGILAENRTIVIYINGIAVAGFNDTTYRAAGRFGFTITAVETAPFTVIFDELAFWSFE